VIVFNNTAVASNPAAGPGVVRRTLLTDENVEEAGIRFDCLTLGADASFRFEPSARSMVWCQMLEGDAKLKTVYTDDLSDRHSVLLPPAFGATALDRTSAELLAMAHPSEECAGRVFAATSSSTRRGAWRRISRGFRNC
jgi:hypothetical protein